MSYFKFNSPIMEAKLTAKDRRELPDEDYGIPSLKKYPMPDRNHTLLAIKWFSKAPPEHKKELAKNIKRKMEQYNIPLESVGEDNELRQYL